MFRYETQAEKRIRTLPFMGPRKAKQEVKFKTPTFYSILYTGYKLHQLVAPPPPPKMRRAKAQIEHSETVTACMSKQIFSTL